MVLVVDLAWCGHWACLDPAEALACGWLAFHRWVAERCDGDGYRLAGLLVRPCAVLVPVLLAVRMFIEREGLLQGNMV